MNCKQRSNWLLLVACLLTVSHAYAAPMVTVPTEQHVQDACVQVQHELDGLILKNRVIAGATVAGALGTYALYRYWDAAAANRANNVPLDVRRIVTGALTYAQRFAHSMLHGMRGEQPSMTFSERCLGLVKSVKSTAFELSKGILIFTGFNYAKNFIEKMAQPFTLRWFVAERCCLYRCVQELETAIELLPLGVDEKTQQLELTATLDLLNCVMECHLKIIGYMQYTLDTYNQKNGDISPIKQRALASIASVIAYEKAAISSSACAFNTLAREGRCQELVVAVQEYLKSLESHIARFAFFEASLSDRVRELENELDQDALYKQLAIAVAQYLKEGHQRPLDQYAFRQTLNRTAATN